MSSFEIIILFFLIQVREFWQTFEVELINYQKKTKLIRGWDDLFNKLKEHMNSLAAMKLSPYYKVCRICIGRYLNRFSRILQQFEEDAIAWEDKLNRINALFDVWIDVQRRWVYLEGIFSGSADIKTLLPVETGRFAGFVYIMPFYNRILFFSISTEFLALMKKVTAAPRVVDIVNMQGVQRLLERLADLLAKIQKALGEYLERERASFPRFYFVGDEDLLEIIGNSKNIPRLQKHFKKMFAGVASIILNDDSTLVLGLVSREGEQVIRDNVYAIIFFVFQIQFSQPVSIKDNPRINDWLRRVESEMRNTLAMMLAKSVHEYSSKFKGANINVVDYMQWLDAYPV